MPKGTARDGAPHPDRLVAERLGTWIIEASVLLNAALKLRAMGERGEAALDAVLAVREVRILRANWQYWELASEGEGVDPIARLTPYLPEALLRSVRYALSGAASGSNVLQVAP